jgi:hypothetical protein
MSSLSANSAGLLPESNFLRQSQKVRPSFVKRFAAPFVIRYAGPDACPDCGKVEV